MGKENKRVSVRLTRLTVTMRGVKGGVSKGSYLLGACVQSYPRKVDWIKLFNEKGKREGGKNIGGQCKEDSPPEQSSS